MERESKHTGKEGKRVRLLRRNQEGTIVKAFRGGMSSVLRKGLPGIIVEVPREGLSPIKMVLMDYQTSASF